MGKWNYKKIAKSIIGEKTDNRCWYCGDTFGETPQMTMCIDHIVPKSKGGEDTLDNLVPCCRSCNSTKSTKSIAEFRIYERFNRAGMKFSQEQIRWLFDKGFDVLEHLPEYRFYFEKEGLV